MTMTKGSTIKLLIVAFILFVVFKPEKSKQVYEEIVSKINAVQSERTVDDETRLKTVMEKANSIMNKHENEMKPSPPEPVSKCECGGTGQITHGDGHKTPCTCDLPCKCEKPKSLFGEAEKQDLEKFIESSVQKSFDKYIKDYRERASAQTQMQQPVQPTEQTPQ